MGEFFIKPYSFVDFIDKDWLSWKNKNLAEASFNIHQKHLTEMAAFAGNQSAIPHFFDEDDYKFLVQFPPDIWSQALSWRYNEGLIEASKLREEDPDHKLESIKNTRDELKFKAPGGNYYVFNNVYTGFRNLIEKLEMPVKYNKEHNPPGTTPGDYGMQDIDPFETDPNHPRHPSNYKYGLRDYDVSSPVVMSDDMIERIPDDEINVPKGKERTPENIRIVRDAMKKNKPHSLAGFKVLKPITASTQLSSWVYAQALGLLGQPKEIKDPYTNQPLDVMEGDPYSINHRWQSHIGDPDKNGIKLKIPLIKRKLNYKIVNKNGKTKYDLVNDEIKDVKEDIISDKLLGKINKRNLTKLQKLEIEANDLKAKEALGHEVAMPVLRPGLALPRIELSPEQRKEFARRNVNKKTGEEGTGQIGSLYNLLRNWDILTPEQKEHIVKNQRTLLHLNAVKHGNTKDKWSKPDQYYVAGGFSPNNTQPEVTAHHLTDEELKIALDKYYPMLLNGRKEGQTSGPIRGTLAAVHAFIANARNKNKLPLGVIEMLSGISPDIAKLAAALLGLNLNNPNLGIYDPEMKLYGTDKNLTEKQLDDNRWQFTWNFAKNISQIAWGDQAPRRARQKGIFNRSLDAQSGTGEDSGSLKDTLASGKPASDSLKGKDWYTRRTHFNPSTDSSGSISRLTWQTPKTIHAINDFFKTKRAEIEEKLGEKYAKTADDAISAVERMAQEAKHAGEEINQRREKFSPETQEAEDEYMSEFFTKVIAGHQWPFPVYNDEEEDFFPGPKRGLDDMKKLDAKGVVGLIKSAWTVQGAAQFAVPLLMAINQYNKTPIDEKTAIDQVKEAGVTPEQKPVTNNQPQTIPMPQTAHQKPAVAATDLTGMLAALPNNPSLVNQLNNKREELLKPENREALKTAYKAINDEFAHHYKTTTVSSELMHAHILMQALMAKVS